MKPIFFIFSSTFVVTFAEVYYKPQIMDSIKQCDDFENKFLDFDGMEIGSSKGEDGEETTKVGGNVVIMQPITDDLDIELDVWKMLEIVDEYMYNTRSNFCDSIGNTNSPWYPLLQKLNITACPIPMKMFTIDDMKISLESLKDVLSHDFCGEYRVQASLVKVTEKISCHVLEMAIAEYNDE